VPDPVCHVPAADRPGRGRGQGAVAVAVFAVAVAVAVAGGRWQWHHRIGRGSAVILSGDKVWLWQGGGVAVWRGMGDAAVPDPVCHVPAADRPGRGRGQGAVAVAVFAVAVAVAVAGGRWQWHHRIGRGSAVILSGDKVWLWQGGGVAVAVDV
jgi:hypothetical protein